MNEIAISEMNELKPIAVELAKSSLIPAHYKKPEDAWYAILCGREYGLSPMVSLQSIAVVKGKITMSADLIVALCRRNPEFAGMSITDTETSCTVTVKRKCSYGTDERTVCFTMDDAKKAGLLDKDNWKAYPKRMLKARATKWACQDLFSDVIGNVYTPEELDADTSHPSPIVPEYDIVDKVDMIALANTFKEIKDILNFKVALVSSKKSEYMSSAELALKNKDMAVMTAIKDELDKLAQAPSHEPKKEIVQEIVQEQAEIPMPEPCIGEEIVALLQRLMTAGFNSAHASNSVNKHLGLTTTPENWQAITYGYTDKEKGEAYLKYLKGRETDLEKKAKAKADAVSSEKDDLLAQLDIAMKTMSDEQSQKIFDTVCEVYKNDGDEAGNTHVKSILDNLPKDEF